jgi:hypothetical protein
MAYILYRTNGTVLTTIQDGSIDKSSTPLTLVGKNYSGYGQLVNQDLIKLTENFAYNVQPSNSLTGQLWYDSGSQCIKVYNGKRFRQLSAVDSTSGSPTDAVQGDFWWNPNEGKLYFNDGNTFQVVGPQFTGISTNNIITTKQISDTGGVEHFVLESQLQPLGGSTTATSVSAVFSVDEFTINPTQIPGFNKIKPGITLNGADAQTGVSTSTGYLLWGTAADSLRLNGQLASSYVTASSPQFTGQLYVQSTLGIKIGSSADLLLQSGQDSSNQVIGIISANNSNGIAGSSLQINVNLGGSGSTATNVVRFGAGGGGTPAILPTNATGLTTNIGSITAPFGTVYANKVNAGLFSITTVFPNDASRDAAIPAPTIGMIIVNGTHFQGNIDGTITGWVNLN